MSYATLRMKFALTSNDAGAWGEEPDSDSATAVLRSTEISLAGHINPEGAALRKLSPREASATIVRPGDILVVKSSGSDAHLGKSGWVNDSCAGMSFSNFIQRLRVGRNFESRFTWYFMNCIAMKDQVRTLSSTSTGLQNLSASLIREIEVPAPPLDEQRRIADFLDDETGRIDSLARAQKRARAVLLERRAATVFAAVTGARIPERMPSKLAWADSLPASWQSVKLGHFARMGSGHTPSRSHAEWWEDCTIPWITTGEVSQVRDDRLEVLTETRERISEIGMANSSAELHPRGTVVLCRTASAGYSAVMGLDMATSQDFVTWTCGPHLDPFYLLWCLRAMRADLLGRLAMGSTHKTIYVPDLQMLRIPLPPLGEQHSIVESIRTANTVVDAAVDAIDRQLDLLAERRQALITAAVTGEIDVTTAGRATEAATS